ncbi:leucine-rich repeat and death domain-containing protein 1-like [Anopheles stephensi]|uniref:leucine-rich repeat and death domain-containing protein 1-like n=1 Tax=Anopheles stephensi TaxID=30069 RepID=UPI0016589CF8|nr:leucine-rich repeat and death domain-containing protein 1-like [Anopheles stephensi]
MMTCINRVCTTLLPLILLCHPSDAMKFYCNNVSCMLENLDLDEAYTFAFAYSINTTFQLTAMYVKGDIFDLTTLPNLSNLRVFVLDHSQLNSVIVKFTAEKSSLSITNTPLKTIVLHESRHLEEARIDKSLLEAIPETFFTQASLETLFITNSLLAVIDFNPFETLPNLRHVDFSCNRIHVLHLPPTSTCCRRLISLDLTQNRLTHFNFGLLAHMNCLEVLALRRNRIASVAIVEPIDPKPPNLTQFCTTVVRIHAYTQPHPDSTSHSRYASLTTIDLDSNRMREANLSMFCAMPNLMELMLSRNLLTSVTVTDGQLPARLEALELSFNRLATADLRPLYAVKMVNVGANQ